MHSKSYKNSVFLSICVFAFKMSVSKPKSQHTDRTLKEKIEILGKLDSGLKAVDVCKRFNQHLQLLNHYLTCQVLHCIQISLMSLTCIPFNTVKLYIKYLRCL